MNTIIKNVKRLELNAKIVSVVLDVQTIQMFMFQKKSLKGLSKF